MRNNTNKRLLAFVLSSVLLLTVLVGGLALLLFSNNNNGADPIANVDITTTDVTVGQTEQLFARAQSLSGVVKAIDGAEWKSLDETIASVTSDGKIGTIRTGKVDVQATYEGKTSTKTINIKDVDKQETGKITGSSTMKVGNTQKLTAVFNDVANPDLDWTTDGRTVATVDSEGNVSAIAVGKATIKARISNTNYYAKIDITVIGDGEGSVISEIDLGDDILIGKGMTQTLSYKTVPQDATNFTLKWSSEAKNIVDVDAQGTITAKKEGSANILVSVNEDKRITATVLVKVVDSKADSVTINGKNETTVEEVFELTSHVTPDNLIAQGTTWSFDNSMLALTDENGAGITFDSDVFYEKVNVRALKVGTGTTTIKATRDGITTEHTITIGERKAAEKVTIIGGNQELAGGQSKILKANVEPASALKDIIWSTSDNTIVDIVNYSNGDAEITAKAKGSANITVKYRDVLPSNTDLQDTIVVKVGSINASEITGVNITNQVLRVSVDGQLEMTSETLPENIKDAVYWRSDTNSKATVTEEGVVTGVAVGPATILAKIYGNDQVWATVTVEVTETPDAESISIQNYTTAVGPNAEAVPYGTVVSFKPTITPSNATAADITWEFPNKGSDIKLNNLGTNENGVTSFQIVKTDVWNENSKNEVTIKATYNGYTPVSDSITLKLDPEPTVTDIEVSGPEGIVGATSIDSGDAITLTARAFVKNTNGSENTGLSAGVKQEFRWRSLDESIVKLVNPDYDPTITDQADINSQEFFHGETPTTGSTIQVKGFANGTATIEAYNPTNQTILGQIIIDVNAANSLVERIIVTDQSNKASGTVYAASTFQVKATGLDSVGNVVPGATFHFWSSDESIAVADDSGVVTPVVGASGRVNVYAVALGTEVDYGRILPFTLTVSPINYLLYNFVNNAEYIDAVANPIRPSEFDGDFSAKILKAYIDSEIIAATVDKAAYAVYPEYNEFLKEISVYMVFNFASQVAYHHGMLVSELFGTDNKIGTIITAFIDPTQENIDAAKAVLSLDLTWNTIDEFVIPYVTLRDMVDALVAKA